jgi:flagellar assembly protein FliH
MASEPSNLTAWERWEIASLDAPVAPPPAAPQTSGGSAPATAAVVLPTATEVELIVQRAHDEGQQAGYAEGRQLAQAEAARIASVLQQLESALTEFDQKVGEEVLVLAIEIARRVVEQEVAAEPTIVLNVVRRALAELPHLHATVHLNPDDAALVRDMAGEQLGHAGHRIVEDAAVARGGCLVEAGGSHVDASLSTRWRRVLESIGAPTEWIAAADK